MSFPNIPNITPCITITLEEAVNLLLTSIALEEISLSKLMDAEKDKIEFVIGDCKHKDSKLHDSVVINKSVNETIQNLIKLQMLLQFKLEHVKEIIPCSTTTCSTTTTSTTTTTSCTRTTTTVSKTTTTTSCTYTTTTSCPCVCCLRGKGRGGVTNTCDRFYMQTAFLQALIIYGDIENRYIRYFVQNECESLYVKASCYGIKMECPNCLNAHTFVAYGKCHIEKRSKCCSDYDGPAFFKLIVRNGKNGRVEFMMHIFSDINPEIKHNSGFVPVKSYDSDLRFH